MWKLVLHKWNLKIYLTAEDAATRWEEDRSTGTECRSIDWAEMRPIYIMVVKNATKYWACMIYY